MSLNGGYAMIKYNSTQEELQIAYRSKKPVLFYDENQKAHWAVIEETATESVDEETQEPITLYEYSYKLLNDIEALVDAKGRNRFIEIDGRSGEMEGMQIYYGKCVLNGNNLIFEIQGIFNKSMSADFTLYEFTLPEWIAQKVPLAYGNVVELTRYFMITTTTGTTGVINNSAFTIYKYDNVLKFWQAQPVDVTGIGLFRIRYNLIIDNE